jgi:hypothetical protein
VVYIFGPQTAPLDREFLPTAISGSAALTIKTKLTMRIFFHAALFVMAAVSLASCSSGDGEVDVVVDKLDSAIAVVIIDDTIKLKLSEDPIVLRMKPGTHTVVYKDGAKETFNVSKKGGLLNLDKTDYVVFEVLFEEVGAKESFSMQDMVLKACILVDSFVIMPKQGIGFTSDSLLRSTIVPELLASKNGTYYPGAKIEGVESNAVHGMKKVAKGQLFIDKNWDYNTIKDIPETIEIRKAKYSVGKASETKKTILDAQTFLILAILEPDQYTVRTLQSIREGKKPGESAEDLDLESILPEGN